MLTFQPYREMLLQIKQASFAFVPRAPDEEALLVIEGRTACVYQLRELLTDRLYALKVFKPASRDEHSVRVTEFLLLHPELQVFQREGRMCLTRYSAPDLVQTFPELEYAVLMPWNAAPTWAALVPDPQTSASYSREQALDLARAMASALWNLEALGAAHADLAGSKLALPRERMALQLLDPEGMFLPGRPLPGVLSQGTPGYRHRQPGPAGQCCRAGDRFAGAILLTELLTWWDPRVRARVADHAETLFRQEELQTDAALCWPAVRETLYGLSPDLLALFDRAWFSQSLADCPPLSAWGVRLLSSVAG